MEKMKKLAYAVCSGVFLSGLTILFSYKPKYIGLILVILSLGIGYFLYSKNRAAGDERNIDIKNAALGIILIVTDVSYNILSNGAFASFDYGIILSGLLIIALNFNLLKFLKLEREFVGFLTLFLFLILMFYGFLFSGIPFLLKTEENPWFVPVTKFAVTSSAYLLNLIKPTSVTGGTDIYFDGFNVGVWIPCSGVESITVFVAAAAAFFITTKEKNMSKILILSTIGVAALFLMNILRIVILVLVGHHYGADTMLFVHFNLGWILFTLGIAVFWFLVFDSKEGNRT